MEEYGQKLFGVHRHWAEADKILRTDIRTGDNAAKRKMLGPLDSKEPYQYQIGDWGFIRDALKALSRVSPTEYLVVSQTGHDEETVLLIRGFDMSKLTDGVKFVLCQPVVMKTTFTYRATSGATKNVLVAESSNEEVEKAFAKAQKEAARKLAAVESARLAQERELQARMESRRKLNTRVWTDTASKKTITAEFIYCVGDKIKLKKEDGTVVLLPIEHLSGEDQEWVRNWPELIRNWTKAKTLQPEVETSVEKQPVVVEPMKERAVSQPMNLPPPAQQTSEDSAILLGKWRVSSAGGYHAAWTFLENGVVLSTAGSKKGTWRMEKTAVHIAWEAQAWDTFNRPLNVGRTTGDSWLGKAAIVAVKIGSSENLIVSPESPATDNRSRWVSETYPNTAFIHRRDKQWAQIDTKTQKTVYNDMVEKSRSPKYIELFFPTRNQTYRLSAKRMELKGASGWSWAHNGHWENESSRP
jgi:hypothetical protein